jgi:hypothetical protein
VVDFGYKSRPRRYSTLSRNNLSLPAREGWRSLRLLRIVLQAKAHLHDLLLARSQSAQHLPGLLLQVHVDGSLVRCEHRAVFDEVVEMRIPLLTNWRL